MARHKEVAPKAPVVLAEDVRAAWSLQRVVADTRKRLKEYETKLAESERPIIALLEAGASLEPGCPPCAVQVDRRVTVAWKDEALTLAVKAGHVLKVYEAAARARGTVSESKHLVINGGAV